jgi:deoxyribodipyrimidine photo-lyase
VSIYALDDRAPGLRPLGGAARWWLAQSLRALQASLREQGALLVLRKGAAPRVIAALAAYATIRGS